MASLASLLEDFRNYRGVQDWNLGRQEDQMLGHSEQARGLWQLLQGLGVGDVAGIGAIKAYHGSPHLFDKFDMSKIGTGEGAQEYGHGLYFAEHPDVAKSYADMGKTTIAYNGKVFPDGSPESIAAELLHSWQGDKAGALDDALGYENAKLIRKHIQAMDPSGLSTSENLYTTSLEWPDPAREAAEPMGPQHFLDWDTELLAHPQSLISAIKKWSPTTGRSLGQYNNRYVNDLPYDTAMFSREMMDAGIPGIRYLDQGSRGAGEGTANYVVFDDRIPRIVARNGVPVRGLKGIVGQ